MTHVWAGVLMVLGAALLGGADSRRKLWDLDVSKFVDQKDGAELV